MKKFILAFLFFAAALPCFASSFTDSRDGQKYKTVKIGEQVWMAENLNYQTGNSWCYENNAANCKKYGRLYDWETANKVCPAGWHLPSKSEFETLVRAVGGGNVAGKKLKSKSGWYNGGNGTDAFGFAALPAGYYHSNYDFFYDEGKFADFWSSTESTSGVAYSLDLDYDLERPSVLNYTKFNGFSVRCLKND